MRHPAWALAAVAAVGCHPAADTQPTATTTPTVAVAAAPTTMPAVPAHPIAIGAVTPLAGRGLPGIFKPIPDRSTDDLLLEVEAPGTRDRLPLLAELAKRTGDRDRVRPVMVKLQANGVYAVRVAAAMVAVALDAEHPGPAAADLIKAVSDRAQTPVYGPLVEDTPELRRIQALAVPGLAKAVEREMDDAKKEHSAAALAALGTMPKQVGEPALAAVRKVAATETHPDRTAAREVLKKWGTQ
jgi:hypothetical protein